MWPRVADRKLKHSTMPLLENIYIISSFDLVYVCIPWSSTRFTHRLSSATVALNRPDGRVDRDTLSRNLGERERGENITQKAEKDKVLLIKFN